MKEAVYIYYVNIYVSLLVVELFSLRGQMEDLCLRTNNWSEQIIHNEAFLFEDIFHFPRELPKNRLHLTSVKLCKIVLDIFLLLSCSTGCFEEPVACVGMGRAWCGGRRGAKGGGRLRQKHFLWFSTPRQPKPKPNSFFFWQYPPCLAKFMQGNLVGAATYGGSKVLVSSPAFQVLSGFILISFTWKAKTVQALVAGHWRNGLLWFP